MESIIIQQKEKINMLNIQQKDEIDALQKKLQSNKCALDTMKKTLDNEKAFRICADQEIINLKEQIKSNINKNKSLENENEKLISEKFKAEEAKNKISQQCNELIQKNISLENYCEKKELAFDEQTNLINQLENNITNLNKKINNYIETEEENDKLIKQIKLLSKQMETYENEREVYVQRLQKMQIEENQFKCILKDFKKDVDIKNGEINILRENVFNISSKNAMLSTNNQHLQTNFTNCLKLLEEIVDCYVKNQVKQNKTVESNQLPSKLEPFLNETFELFEQTLTEYKLLKLSIKESEIILKDEINKKENTIRSLNDKLTNYEQIIVKQKLTNTNIFETKNNTECLNQIQSPNDACMGFNHMVKDELKKNLVYINTIKVEVLPQQRLLISECNEFLFSKIKEIENLNVSKNNYIKTVLIKIDQLVKEIVDKNTTIKGLKSEVLTLQKEITEKDSLCNEMEIELQQLKDNFGILN